MTLPQGTEKLQQSDIPKLVVIEILGPAGDYEARSAFGGTASRSGRWNPTGAHPHDADWALRAKRAHYNAVENLAVFAPLVLIVVLTGTGSAVTAAAAASYFVLRLAHYLIHLAAIPVLRTVVFMGGWTFQMLLGLSALGLT